MNSNTPMSTLPLMRNGPWPGAKGRLRNGTMVAARTRGAELSCPPGTIRKAAAKPKDLRPAHSRPPRRRYSSHWADPAWKAEHVAGRCE
jgi:hypothetical protein